MGNRELSSAVQQPAAPKPMFVGESCMIEISVEHSKHALLRARGPLQTVLQQTKPFGMAAIEIRHDQVVFGGKIVVQAHLRDRCLGGDRVDPGRGDSVGVKPPTGGLQQLLSRDAHQHTLADYVDRPI